LIELQTDQGIVRVPSGTWHVDPDHSSVEFEVKHMKIATIRGRFRDFEGTLVAAEDIAGSRAFGAVNVASVDTNQAERDAHLRSPEFFDVQRYPTIRFQSTRIEPVGGPQYRVVGDLTIKDVTREVKMETTVDGVERDPWGNERVGMRAHGTIDRKDFGLRWQQTLETGGLLLGDEVRILIDVSAVRA
jgi:polyisoprenoid-binding protein YceI